MMKFMTAFKSSLDDKFLHFTQNRARTMNVLNDLANQIRQVKASALTRAQTGDNRSHGPRRGHGEHNTRTNDNGSMNSYS